MGTTFKIASRGQITNPMAIRDTLGIEIGYNHGLRALDGGILVVTPIAGNANTATKKLRAALAARSASLDETLEERRRMREEVDA